MTKSREIALVVGFAVMLAGLVGFDWRIACCAGGGIVFAGALRSLMLPDRKVHP